MSEDLRRYINLVEAAHVPVELEEGSLRKLGFVAAVAAGLAAPASGKAADAQHRLNQDTSVALAQMDPNERALRIIAARAGAIERITSPARITGETRNGVPFKLTVNGRVIDPLPHLNAEERAALDGASGTAQSPARPSSQGVQPGIRAGQNHMNARDF